MYPFSCVLWALRQIARYLPHHRSENASKTHPKSSHDKFKTASNTFLLVGLSGKNLQNEHLQKIRIVNEQAIMISHIIISEYLEIQNSFLSKSSC